jgi:hypothetical protein
MKIRLSVSLFTCGKCHREYNNRLTHVCRVSMRELGKPASKRGK